MGVEDTYDAVAADYAAQFADELDRKPFDRQLLAAVAARCAGGTVLDVGCGPGQIGAAVGAKVGLDLSHEMLRLAPFPLRVHADVRAMPFAPATLAGAVAFYSLIHLAGRAELDEALTELARVLRPGGVLVVAVHEGSGVRHLEEWFGHPVDIDARLWSRDELVDALGAAGLTIESAVVRDRYEGETTDRLYVTAVASA